MLRVTSVEMLHKTQNCAPFDPKCWYNVRKIKKDNLPYVFTPVLHVRFFGVFKSNLSFFFPSSVFLHYINICGQNLQNPVLISISTDHLNQVESRCYVTPGAGSWLRTVNESITCRVWHHDTSNSSNGLPVISGSHATHWNRKSRTSSPGFFPKKMGGVGKGLFFLGKALGTSLDKAPQQPPLFFLFFNVSSFFDSLLSLYNKVAMEQKYQWLKRLSSH